MSPRSLHNRTRLNRREMLRNTALAGIGVWTAAASRSPGESRSPNEKLSIAGIGVGGQGAWDIGNCAGENIVALCDVDDRRCGATLQKFPKAKRYRDFRTMLDEMGKQIDAVVVATPDHTHAPAAMLAMSMGKHCYCEKPLAHSVGEVRAMIELAQKNKLATQMGTQIHAGANYRRVVELIQAGAIGPVNEVHVWHTVSYGGGDRPQETPPVPAGLDWDLWLGPAAPRPYHPCYCPGIWRSWWDFGSGGLGDFGCHYMDLPFWALKLRHPTSIETQGPPVHPERTSPGLAVHYEFRQLEPDVIVASLTGQLNWLFRLFSGSWSKDLVRRRAAAGIPGRSQDPHLERRRVVPRRERNVDLRLQQAPVAARGPVRRLQAARSDHSQLDRSPRRMVPGVQDGRADDLQLRLLGRACRGRAAGQRGLPGGQEALVGRRGAEGHRLSRGRSLHSPRLPEGMDAVDQENTMIPTLFSVSYAGLWGQCCLDLEAFFAKAAALGYPAVELVGKRPHLSVLDIDQRAVDKLRGAASACGVEIATIAGYTNFTLGRDTEIPAVEIQVAYVRQLADLARRLHAKIVRIFTGYVTQRDSFQADWDICVRGVRECAAAAADCGVILGVQNHHDVGVGVDGYIEFLDEVDHPNCRAMFDPWSPALHGDDLRTCARRLAPRMVQTTLADYVRVPRYAYLHRVARPRWAGRETRRRRVGMFPGEGDRCQGRHSVAAFRHSIQHLPRYGGLDPHAAF